MTYTLTMTESKGIQIADDGIAEVSMTDARAWLTRLIRTVLEGGRVGTFTERGERRAYVVNPAFYDRALEDRLTAEAFRRMVDELPNEKRRTELMQDLTRYREHLAGST